MDDNFKHAIGHLSLTCIVYVHVMYPHGTLSSNMYRQSLLKAPSSFRGKSNQNYKLGQAGRVLF